MHPDVDFRRHAIVALNSSAPRKRLLRIPMGRESQATTVVGVVSSEPACHSFSPEMVVERAGSQAVGLTMGRFAVLATEVDDDVPATQSVQTSKVHEPEEVYLADGDTDTIISEETHDLDV